MRRVSAILLTLSYQGRLFQLLYFWVLHFLFSSFFSFKNRFQFSAEILLLSSIFLNILIKVLLVFMSDNFSVWVTRLQECIAMPDYAVLFFCVTGVWTQGLMIATRVYTCYTGVLSALHFFFLLVLEFELKGLVLAMPVLYSLQPFLLLGYFFFSYRVLHLFPGLALNQDPPVYISGIAGIIWIYHYIWFILWDRSC
jgi:hypothetical protein